MTALDVVIKRNVAVWRQLTDASRRRCDESYAPLASWSPDDWIRAMCGGVGELLNAIKKADDPEHDGRSSTADPFIAVGDEAADVIIYLDLLLQRMGSSIEQAAWTAGCLLPLRSNPTIRDLCFRMFKTSAEIWERIRDDFPIVQLEYSCGELFGCIAYILNRYGLSPWSCVVAKFNRRSREVGSGVMLEDRSCG